MTHSTLSLVRLAAPWTLALALALGPRTAHAQVEARCPAGFNSVPSRGGGMIAACLNPPMQIVATRTEQAIAPSSPEEREIVDQLAQQAGGEGGGITATPFRTEPVGGITARVADLSGAGTNETGAATRVEGTMIIIPNGSASIVVMGMSRDAVHGNVRPLVRTFVSSMVGLTGPAPAWRASASCPAGVPEAPSDGPGPNGMRRVVSCGTSGVGQFDVLESRLPVHNLAEARAPAENLQRQLGGMLSRLGGNATLDATQPVTFGAAHGWATAVHGSATAPNAPPGEAPALRLEGYVVVIPTPIGHVQVVSISRENDANAVAEQARGFVMSQLRLDGSGVRVTPDGGASAAPSATPTAGGDAGEATGASESAPTPPPRREHRIDPNAPLWTPPDETAPAARHEDAPKKGCGCAVPGGARGEFSGGLVAMSAVIAGVIRRRRRVTDILSPR